jgi:large conductance mechanosensitive channel
MLGNPPPGYSGPMTYEALTKAGVPLLAYGNFITIVINFIILAFVIFWMVRQFSAARRRFDAAEQAPPPPPEEVLLLREIRDALKK